MSALENAVQVLADALEELESKLEHRIADADADSDAIIAARREAHAAKARLHEASDVVGAAIEDVKSLLAGAGPSSGEER